MIKLNIFNMEEFLQTVNECADAVNVISPDGRKENITRCDKLQWDLRSRHEANKGVLRLTLDFKNPRDYLKVINFTIGDC